MIVCRSGTFEHNNVARRMANAFERASPKEPCTGVVTDFEMHYVRSRPGSPRFSFRRPNVAWYRCALMGTGNRRPRTCSWWSRWSRQGQVCGVRERRNSDLPDRASGSGSQSQDNPGIPSRLGEP
nr:hypothetical protein [Nocardia asiatica]